MMNLGGVEPREEQKVNKAPSSTVAREAYFLDFARAMQDVVSVPLMVTGGFRTKGAMQYALESGGADVIGLARPLCVTTDGAKQLLDGTLAELPRYEDNLELLPASLAFLKRLQLFKLVNSFTAIFWFYEQIESLGQKGKTIDNLRPITALISTEKRSKRLLEGRTQGLTAINTSDKAKKQEASNANNTVVLTISGIALAFAVGCIWRKATSNH